MSDQLAGSVTVGLVAEQEQFNVDMVKSAQTVTQFGATTAAAAAKSVTALNSVGEAATQSTNEMTASQTRFIQGLQRQVAALHGGRVASQEMKAAQLGISEAAAPLLSTWRQLEAAQKGSATASDVAAGSMAALAESEADATARIRALVSASLDKTAALNREIEASRAAATAARELASAGGSSGGSSINFAAQNRRLQETADLVNEVNSALGSIGRGASSQKELQTQTDKLVSLWSQGRISAEQYATAVKQLDVTETSLTKTQVEATAKADAFIAKLKEQAATAGLTSKQLIEYRAAQLGVSTQAAPLIKQIEDGEKAMHGFSLETGTSRRELGVLARELARGDFGSAGRSFSIFAEQSGLMPTLLSPAVLAIAGLAAGVGVLALAYLQGHEEQSKFANSLIITGNSAGTTAGGLHALAVQAAATGGSLSSAKEAVLELANSGKLTSDQIGLISTAAVEMEAATGKAVRDTIKEFEELGKSPAEASAKLNEQYHYLTQSVYDQIAALERQGDQQAAADLAERTYAAALSTRAADIVKHIGTIETAWRSAKNAATGFWDTVMNTGRTDLLDQDIAEYEKRLANGIWSTADRAVVEERVAALKKVSAAQKEVAAQQQEDARTTAASVEASRAIDQQTESIDKNIRKRNEMVKLSQRFTQMMLEAQRTGVRNERLDNVDFDQAGKPTGGGLYSQLQKDIEDKYKERAAPRGNDNSLNAQIKAIQGQFQEEERALKQNIQNNKAQYDIGLLDTQQYLSSDYEARKAALKNEMDLAKQQEEVASKKKNSSALEEAKNQQKKIRDEQLANEQKYANDLASLQEKSRRDVAQYVESLNASYATRQQAIDNLIAGTGLGDSARDELNRLNQVQQEFDRAAESLRKSREKGEAHGGISQSQYDDELAALKDNLDKRQELEQNYTERIKESQSDAWQGATRFVQNYADSAANVASQIESMFGTASKGMEDAFATFVTTGKLSFGSLATSVIADIARMQARAAISGLFNYAVTAAKTYFGDSSDVEANAQGGVYASEGLSQYRNSVVSRPTLFAFAKGVGLMGEAGSEAIMPLTRAADGSLGVRSVGGSGGGVAISIQNNIDITSNGVQSTTSADGQQSGANELAALISSMTQAELQRQTRQGGIIWNMFNQSRA